MHWDTILHAFNVGIDLAKISSHELMTTRSMTWQRMGVRNCTRDQWPTELAKFNQMLEDNHVGLVAVRNP